MQGMSQEQLGTALGLTFQQVQKYEKGLNRIGAGRLYRISLLLNVSVGFFFEGLPEEVSETDESRAASNALHAFMTTQEGYALFEAFTRIDDIETRKRILDLVNTIAMKSS